MSMKDRFGRVAQRAKDVGSQVKEEAVGAKDDAVAAAQARVDSAKNAAVDKAGEVTERALTASEKVSSLRDGIDESDFEKLIERLPVPESPVEQPWRFSLDKIITAGQKPPTGTGLLLRQLGRIGAIDIGPEEVGFEGDTAKWSKVRGFRTRTLDGMIEHLTNESVADVITGVLPLVPGRGWVAGRATEAVYTLWALTSEMALRDPEAARRQYVCEIEYKGWIRTKEATTGFFTGPCMALVPGLDELFRTEAERHGVSVEAAESTSFQNAEQRAAWLREKRAAIVARREKARKEIEY